MGDKTLRPVNRDIDLILAKIKNQKSTLGIAAKCLRSGESHSGRPHMADAVDNAITVLMQVATHNQADAGRVELVQ